MIGISNFAYDRLTAQAQAEAFDLLDGAENLEDVWAAVERAFPCTCGQCVGCAAKESLVREQPFVYYDEDDAF